MSNERNVEALCSLLSDYVMGEGHASGLDNIELAQWLAARGVLVPSALTDEQWGEIVDSWHYEGISGGLHLRDNLQRIAKGEPTGVAALDALRRP